jgi:YfiH family protein
MMPYKQANWNAPDNIKALATTRESGHSQTPFMGNNLALHVGDNEAHVLQNRATLRKSLNFHKEPQWLSQTHSTISVVVEDEPNRDADAPITRQTDTPLVILTADCLPITLCNHTGTEVAAIHAGWRGLYQGIIENTLNKMHSTPDQLYAWIGPAISQTHYEVGDEVYECFTGKHPKTALAFKPNNGKWLANLPLIAEIVMNALGIHNVSQSNLCTYTQKNDFYSYRRAPQTGRIATLIWIQGNR